MPPVDWRGPAAVGGPRGPPPQQWNGPPRGGADWPGHEGPPGYYGPRPGGPPHHPWYGAPRPMSYPPHHPGQSLGGPPRPDYWHMSMGPQASHPGVRGEPPPGWRGPASMPRPSYDQSTGAAWQQPSSQPPWGPPADGHLRPPGFAEPYHGPPGTFNHGGGGSREPEKAGGAPLKESSGRAPAAVAALPTPAEKPPEAVEIEDPLPAPMTAAERLAGVRLLHSALSKTTIERLKVAGVRDPIAEGSDNPIAEVAAATGVDNTPAAAQVIRSRCARLGLDGAPPPARRSSALQQLGPPRLQASIGGRPSEPCGLWDRFRLRCGQALPEEAPAIPCQLRGSSGGGHVVTPLLIPPSIAA